MATVSERTGIVLAGGYSRRFGEQDKALVTLCGKPLLAHVRKRVSSVTDRVLVSCREEQQPAFENVLDSKSPVEFVPDPVPDQGPLAGLSAALESVETPYTVVVACDMPAVDPDFLALLFARATGSDGAVPRLDEERIQPTQAVYRTEAMATAANDALENGERSLRRALDRLDVTYISPATIEEVTDWASLRNVNTPEELAALESELC